MRKPLLVVLAVLVVAALLSFTVTHTVRFTEAAVVTLFGKADESDVKREPGLYFKLPYPFQSVTTYDTRVRLLTLKLETQQTADNRQVVVESYCTWRVEDPLRFFQRFSNSGERSEDHYREAEKALRANLQSAASLVSTYRMDELFAASGEGKLPELEGRMFEALATPVGTAGIRLADYGIAPVDVGVSRVVLTEEVSKAVFERMKASRERLAKETESRGRSQAQAIRAKAEGDAKRISDFAERLAQDIRTRGDAEAAPYLARMNDNPELAVFLANMDFLRESFGKRTTLVLSGSMPGVGALFPDALEGLKAGQVPSPARRNRFVDVVDGKRPPVESEPTPPVPVAADAAAGGKP